MAIGDINFPFHEVSLEISRPARQLKETAPLYLTTAASPQKLGRSPEKRGLSLSLSAASTSAFSGAPLNTAHVRPPLSPSFNCAVGLMTRS